MTRKDFLTPPDMPGDEWCRTLKMPASKEWLGIFNDALLMLTNKWRYEQVDAADLSIDETVAKVHEILNDFWEGLECGTCLQPTGQPFIRINELGEFEELQGDEWVEPDGDYTIPPITPRTTGTEHDKRCLAAANAANVLKQLYEQVSDNAQEGVLIAEAIVDFVILVATLIAAPISLAIAALIALSKLIFSVVFDTAEFVTMDAWNANFDDKLQCALYECADVDGSGVVTFGFDCFNNALARGIDVFNDVQSVLLFGQLQAMLGIIGGDGLNLAGATTAITSADCDFCDLHCFYLDLRLSNGSAYGLTLQGGEWVNGVGLRGLTYSGSVHATWGYVNFGGTKFVVRVQAIYTKTNGAGATNVWYARGLYPTATSYNIVQAALDPFFSLGTNLTKNSDFAMDLAGYGFDINSGTAPQQPILQSLRFEYYGPIPSGWSDNCPP